MNTKTFRAGPESVAAENFVNEAYTSGKTVTVNGVRVWTRYSTTRPASSWGNGSFSWSSRARTTRGTVTNWAKEGSEIRVTVENA